MSTGLYVFTMLTHFAGYESVHFGLHYAAKNEPTGAAWGLMHFPVMMHYPVMYGRVLCSLRDHQIILLYMNYDLLSLSREAAELTKSKYVTIPICMGHGRPLFFSSENHYSHPDYSELAL